MNIDAKTQHNLSPDYQCDVIEAAIETVGNQRALAVRCGVSDGYLLKLRRGKASWSYSLQVVLELLATPVAAAKIPEPPVIDDEEWEDNDGENSDDDDEGWD